jgi:hypothetical protein
MIIAAVAKKAEKRGGEATIPATINPRYVGSVALTANFI